MRQHSHHAERHEQRAGGNACFRVGSFSECYTSNEVRMIYMIGVLIIYFALG